MLESLMSGKIQSFNVSLLYNAQNTAGTFRHLTHVPSRLCVELTLVSSWLFCKWVNSSHVSRWSCVELTATHWNMFLAEQTSSWAEDVTQLSKWPLNWLNSSVNGHKLLPFQINFSAASTSRWWHPNKLRQHEHKTDQVNSHFDVSFRSTENNLSVKNKIVQRFHACSIRMIAEMS